ncbi:hypothetical protein MBM09_15430 [Flaviramulus sp. BrNp1-15]|uniref:hypothetical protein n=1 Tax=Flaviramulus sp. BrNp1-15 TaxID=2916754 RepID=UPI001EE79D9E|nr:hypothetical protein [Flaviramulus sp. BrNp1-15]ULC59286.1 hypothetical protein MBM09_15430 [Flaviramulus sp. BrNp1-15]
MIASNSTFLPEDPNIPVWRYMSFSKFMDLISTNSIFFNRADKFDDLYEGFLNPNLKKKINSELFNEFENSKEMKTNLISLFNSIKKFTLINCWNMGYTDSLGMWKSYCSTEEGIAIKSSIERIQNGIIGDEKDSFHIRPIKYLDVENSINYSTNIINFFTYKRPQFSFENELRIIIPYTHSNDIDKSKLDENDEELIPFEFGKKVKIDFKTLVEEIYISPNATEWFVELVKRIVRLSYNIPIKKSEINKKP